MAQKKPGPRRTPLDAARTCPKCAEFKPADDFPLDRSRPNGRHPYCKPCKAQGMREAAARRRETGALFTDNLRRRLRQHGVDLDWYEQQLEANQGGCAICGTTDTGHTQRLAIDHNHTTGAARGLLCHLCNKGLGHLGDSPERLRAALAYLERNGHYGT